MSLRVLAPGAYSLLVDLGRPRTRSLGVPVGGAADRAAYVLGNALVGNGPGAVALEVCLAGPTLRADEPVAGVVFGAPFQLSTQRRRLRAGTTFTLEKGEELHIGGTPTGMRAYLCVSGGFGVPRVLGSGGGLAPIAAGDVLPCAASRTGVCFPSPDLPWLDDNGPLRVLDGPQADWFDHAAFVAASYAVTPDSNRLGLRLRGPALALPSRELVSEPVCPGAVQVTRDGQCIVLGVDGGTIGGYPKVAQVIAADLDRLGRLRPGAEVRFRRVDLSEAEALYRCRNEEMRCWATRLTTAVLSP